MMAAPPLYLPIPPDAGTTLWHGTIMGRGFAAHALPTALDALGCPDMSATSPYVRVSPYGILSRASETSMAKPVPVRSSGRSNDLLPPDRYSPICASASARTSVSRCSMGSRLSVGRYTRAMRPSPSSATLRVPMIVRNECMQGPVIWRPHARAPFIPFPEAP